jgi:integrase
MKLMSKQDQARMLQYLDSEEEHILAKTIYSLLLDGLCVGEIVRLDCENLRNIEDGNCILELASSGRSANHYTGYLLSKVSIEALLKLKDAKNEKAGPVFRSANGKRMTAHELSRILTKSLEKAGSESYSSDSVRKTGIMRQWLSMAPKPSQLSQDVNIDMVNAYLKEIDQK